MNRYLKRGAAFLAAAAAGGIARSQFERDHFVVEETTLYSPKLRRDRTMVFLTDLHDKEFGEGNGQLLLAIRSAAPDAVLIGGDTMIAKPGKASLEVTRRLLEGLAGLGVPVFYGNGNHEQRLCSEWETYGGLYREFRHLLREFGVIYLSDRSAPFGDDIVVSGANIDKIYYRNLVPPKLQADDLRHRLGEADRSRYQILLLHSPLFFDACIGWGADLTLAGHFHGGTIRLPGLGGVMTPQFQFFLPYCAGTFERDGCCMIVGRGLGTHSINIRFNNRPQVAVLKLAPGNAPVCEQKACMTEEYGLGNFV
ncbi:MAG: metallophosphoesterase [Clostridiales bacterium]|nr:metallophosphoesterase [Clostridiales bacterium]